MATGMRDRNARRGCLLLFPAYQFLRNPVEIVWRSVDNGKRDQLGEGIAVFLIRLDLKGRQQSPAAGGFPGFVTKQERGP